jgi:hypothetical protein
MAQLLSPSSIKTVILAMLYGYELVATGELNVKYKKTVKKGQIYVWRAKSPSRRTVKYM